MKPIRTALTAALTCAAGAAMAGVRLPAIFGDNMVLQRARPIPVWGTASPGERVAVSCGGRSAAASAGTNGAWRVTLDPIAGPGPLEFVVRGSTNQVAFTNVVMGDVWLCSGQSNMEWPLSKSTGGDAQIASATVPGVRLFTVRKHSAREPQFTCGGSWAACTPRTAAGFSAVAYHFGKSVQRFTKTPVGLVHSAWSGACGESLMPFDAIAADPKLRHLVKRWEKYRADFPARMAAYEAARAAWERAKTGGAPKRPKDPDGPETSLGGLYNGMLHPLVPFAIRGVIFYQAENNVLNPPEYGIIFPALIREWRRRWGQGDFPFLFVQIANFGEREATPADSPWARIREAQAGGLAEPNTAMVCAIDLGEANSLHPGNKKDVGERLARAALALAYGDPAGARRGPSFASARFDGGRARVKLDVRNGRLTVRGDRITGFAVAGEDRRFVWADARIESDTVTVWSDAVPKPAAVRYAWGSNPAGSIYDEAGMPAEPFRTDDWPQEKLMQ